jgi:hypothetical protein
VPSSTIVLNIPLENGEMSSLLTGWFSIFQREKLDIMMLLPARGHVPLSKAITNLSISILFLGLLLVLSDFKV